MVSNCYFLVSVAGSNPQKIVLELENEMCPRTVANFVSFCKSTSKKSYKNTIFHRIIPGFMVQGGDYENGDGTGGEAYDGGTLIDECFDMKHDAPGILSMANRGKDTAGSQFFITLGKASHLDGKHVAFGRVIEGMDVIRDMEKVETDDRDKPINIQKVKIIDAGIGFGNILDSDSDSSSDDRKDRHTSQSKSSNKKHKKKSKKRRKYESDSDSDESSSVSSARHHKKHHKKKHKKSKDSKKHKRKHHNHDESDNSSDDTHHKKRKHKDKYDSDDSDRDKKRRKKRKKSKSRRSSRHDYSSDEDHSKSHKERKSDRRKHDENSKQESTFGKYGIIRESDLRTSTKVQRSFEIWLEEVKGIPQGTNVPKWEMTEVFKDYAEDFNTATLPHEKYYDYDKWEMEEYNRKKQESQSKNAAISDEFQFLEERKKQAEDKRRKELELVRMTMSKEKIEEMKRQSRLKAEMVNAYRVGDEQKRKKLQKRLEPDEK